MYPADRVPRFVASEGPRACGAPGAQNFQPALDMPPSGLTKFAPNQPARGSLFSARRRLGLKEEGRAHWGARVRSLKEEGTEPAPVLTALFRAARLRARARARARRVRIGVPACGRASVTPSSRSAARVDGPVPRGMPSRYFRGLRVSSRSAARVDGLLPRRMKLLHCDEISELGFAARKHSRYCLHTSECMLPEIAMLPAERSRNDLSVDGVRRTA